MELDPLLRLLPSPPPGDLGWGGVGRKKTDLYSRVINSNGGKKIHRKKKMEGFLPHQDFFARFFFFILQRRLLR
jgi:hypothetical protein